MTDASPESTPAAEPGSDGLVIEKGIPIPTKNPGNRWGSGGVYSTAFRKMDIGDSFVVRADKLSTIYSACRRNGWKVKVQKLDYNIDHLRAVRVWKIDPDPPDCSAARPLIADLNNKTNEP